MSRADQAAALEAWAHRVKAEELSEADTETLRRIAALVDQREALDAALVDAVRAARRAECSWSQIGAMLGVSKQAAQQKYRAHTE